MVSDSLTRLPARIHPFLARRFGVDARALAALRVALGGLLLVDLLLRARSLTAFYTDAGVLPRSELATAYPTFSKLSLHALFGAAWWQALLFVVAGGAALALLVGYRTRLATAASLLLLASLHARNPLVLNGGDVLLRRLVFWSLFLPLGTRWSVDALTRADASGGNGRLDRSWLAAPATAALLGQVVVVYTVNAVLKLNGSLWLSGEAVRYVFSLDQFTVLLGDSLAGYPGLLTLLAHAWLVLVTGSVFLLLLTGWRRAALAGAFAGAHLGMLLTMQLGLFPLISVAALLPFLPPSAWDRVERRVEPLRERLAVSAGADRLASLPTGPSVPPGVREWVGRASSAVVAVLLAAIVVWNAATLGAVTLPEPVDDPDLGDQFWNMFAPNPLQVDGWYVAPAETVSGARVDAFHGGPATFDRPPDVADAYPTARWRKYLTNLRSWYGLQPAFADYLCRHWNATHEDDLASVTVYFVAQPTVLDGPEPTERRELVQHDCTGG